MSNVNSAVNVPTCSGKTPQVNLLSPAVQTIRGQDLYFITQFSRIRCTVSAAQVFGTEMDTSINNGRQQNFQYGCGEFLLSGLSLLSTYEFKKHDQIIRTHTQEFFQQAENLDYAGPYPEPKFCGADYMSSDVGAQFLEWYEEQKDKIFAISKSSCPTAWMMLMY